MPRVLASLRRALFLPRERPLNVLARLLSLDYRRRRRLRTARPGPLRDLLAVPFTPTDRDCRRVEYVAIDLETTGLDPARDEIVSVGFVCLNGLRIDLGSACHRLVRQTRAIPERSAVIHQITDDAAAGGDSLEAVVAELLPVLAGRVLIAHHARVELGFLGAACERLYGGRPLLPVVDTQFLAQRRLERRNQPFAARELRLAALRSRYNLPRYRAHDALSDALAAAELFAAQVAECDTGQPLPLKRFLLPQ
jgi:DNA polymerase-3 subunit epsilon